MPMCPSVQSSCWPERGQLGQRIQLLQFLAIREQVSEGIVAKEGAVKDFRRVRQQYSSLLLSPQI